MSPNLLPAMNRHTVSMPRHLRVELLEDRTVPASLQLLQPYPRVEPTSNYGDPSGIASYEPSDIGSYSAPHIRGKTHDPNDIGRLTEGEPVSASSSFHISGAETFRVIPDETNGERVGDPVHVKFSYEMLGTIPPDGTAQLNVSARLHAPGADTTLVDGSPSYTPDSVLLEIRSTVELEFDTTIGSDFSISHDYRGQGQIRWDFDPNWGFYDWVQWDIAYVDVREYIEVSRPLVRFIDATTEDFRIIDLNYQLPPDSPGFVLNAFLSKDEKYSPDDDPLTVSNGRVTEADDLTAGLHPYELRLTQKAPITKQKRFIIVMADPADPEWDRSSLFVIPLFETDEKGGFIPANDPATSKFKMNLSEAKASGAIKGRISRGTLDFDRLIRIDTLWQSAGGSFALPDPAPYVGDDWRVDKIIEQPLVNFANLIVLARGQNRFNTNLLTINDAFDEQGDHEINSLHYEGRAIDAQADQGEAMERLTGLAMLAGFDRVHNEKRGSRTHLHASAGYHGGDPAEEAKHHATVSTDALLQAMNWGKSKNLFADQSVYDSLVSILTDLKGIIDTYGTPLPPAHRKAAMKLIREYMKQVKAAVKSGAIEGSLAYGMKVVDGTSIPNLKKDGILLFNAKRLADLL
jgi:hypothetical protein